MKRAWKWATEAYGKKLTLAVVVVLAMNMIFAVTQIDLTSQVKGTLPIGNGGTNASSISTGVVRSNGSTLSGAELSGDATTSGSNVVSVAKINGTSVPTNSAADQILGTSASATAQWETIPNCPAGALQYTQASHTWACGAVLTGTFADAEVPTGTINGSNVTFTLAHTPSPAASLSCYENGVQQRAGGADYTLATSTITYGVAPPTGTTLVCFYRY